MENFEGAHDEAAMNTTEKHLPSIIDIGLIGSNHSTIILLNSCFICVHLKSEHLMRLSDQVNGLQDDATPGAAFFFEANFS